MARATPGSRSMRRSSAGRVSSKAETALSAPIVAVRGPPSITAISPKYDPGPSVETSLPEMLTPTVPLARTKNPFPFSPSVTMRTPGWYSTAWDEPRTDDNWPADSPENSGMDRRASRCSDWIHRSPSQLATIRMRKMAPGTNQEATTPAMTGTDTASPRPRGGHDSPALRPAQTFG